jgi:hypothetical protein
MGNVEKVSMREMESSYGGNNNEHDIVLYVHPNINSLLAIEEVRSTSDSIPSFRIDFERQAIMPPWDSFSL